MIGFGNQYRSINSELKNSQGVLTYVRIKPQFWRSGHLGKPSIRAVRIITHVDSLFPESNGGKGEVSRPIERGLGFGRRRNVCWSGISGEHQQN